MKRMVGIWVLAMLVLFRLPAQEIPEGTEQMLENRADAGAEEEADDQWWQEMEFFRKHPVDINQAGADQLRQLRILNDMQISRFLAYRVWLGKLLSVYELQAVPGWDLATIRQLLPYITLSPVQTIREDLLSRLRKGEHSVLLRAGLQLERSRGYEQVAGSSAYLGHPLGLMFRYRYSYKHLLQYGILGEKDAGEPFFKGAQRAGFDFYSLHFFVRNAGAVKAWALGDFTVCMGQGLVHWQGFSGGRGGDVLQIRRQQEVLRPYHSAGEYHFHRGTGITLQQGRIQLTVFGSYRKLSAHIGGDSSRPGAYVTSLVSGGYHRTASELNNRNRLRLYSAGAVMRYAFPQGHLALNGLYQHTSLPIEKREEPYNRYALRGRQWTHLSLDYAFTFRNLHVFGELAGGAKWQPAFMQGFLLSLHHRVDISVLYRHISPAYQAMSGQAFTTQTLPANERGIYAGICLRPGNRWKLEAYADLYYFPWLSFHTDAPARGMDYQLRLSYRPGKQTEITTRYRYDARERNQLPANGMSYVPVFLPRSAWRIQVNQVISPVCQLRSRAEALWYNRFSAASETGFLLYTDLLVKPRGLPFSGVTRLQYFETEGYNSRIYTYENEVLYSYSLPGYSGRGLRYYVLLHLSFSRKWEAWLHWSQSRYPDLDAIGSGPDQVAGNRKSVLKLQFRVIF